MVDRMSGVDSTQADMTGDQEVSNAARPARNHSKPRNRMDATGWIPAQVETILDVGCNVGELLYYCIDLFPDARLAGVEVNPAALQKAKLRLPRAELHHAGAEN